MKKTIVLFLVTMVLINAAACGQKAVSDMEGSGNTSQAPGSSGEKAPETCYDIAVYTLTHYYERIYTGKEKARSA